MASLFQSPHYARWSLAVLEMGPSSSTAMGSSESAPFALLARVALALHTELPLSSHGLSCFTLLAVPQELQGAAGPAVVRIVWS